MNGSDIRPPVLLSWEQTSTVSNLHYNLLCTTGICCFSNPGAFLGMMQVFPGFSTFSSLLSKVFNGMSLGDLQAFINEQEKLAISDEPEREDSPEVKELGGCLDDSLGGKPSQEPGKNGERGYTVRLVHVSKLQLVSLKLSTD